MGFPAQNFVQGQVSAGAPGTPGGVVPQQLQSSQTMTHTGKMSTTRFLSEFWCGMSYSTRFLSLISIFEKIVCYPVTNLVWLLAMYAISWIVVAD